MWQLHPLRSITPFSPVAIHTFLHAPLFLHREYLSKIDLEVLEHAEAYLSGQKKQELSDWWLHYIEESVDTYLQQHGYDPSCVPFEYLDKPPSSMARLQDNIRIVHRLLGDLGHKRHPHTTKTQAELINPVKKSVYEKVDTLSTHLKLVLWDQINGYGCRMDFNHIYSLRSAAFLEEAYQHLDTIRGIISREDSAGLQELLDDIVYLEEVRRLDETFFDPAHASAANAAPRSGPSDIVPITGLIVNRIHRLENEFKTVQDHWRGRIPS